jgi:hypothetical protein
MKSFLLFSLCLSAVASGQTALTIYNQDFAVVRDAVPLQLSAGESTATYSGVTTRLEPDSVVLRDPTGQVDLVVLEQNYRADTISQALLLSLYEGQELDFLVRDQDGREFPVRGRVIRSGYVPGSPQANQPIIEVDGRLRFSLPGQPVFPALNDDAILKPMLTWRLDSPAAATVNAELSYLTGGLSWQAAYNLVAPETGDVIDLIGWVTMTNNSGTTFENAAIKLMAGDVNRVEPSRAQDLMVFEARSVGSSAPVVTERTFDEFHLYTLARPATLRDRETKQVEFVRALGVTARTLYIYDGAQIAQYRGWNQDMIRNNPDYGTQSNPKVWVMREIENTEANGLGMPLPAGRTRFYREDEVDGRLEFTGENTIDHTPRNETLRIYTGDAFDIVGERRRAAYVLSNRNDSAEEAFEIRVRNRKTEPVEVRIVEHLYRWVNWDVVQRSHDFIETDAQTVEFRVPVPADGETVVTYRVRYNWQ